MEENKRFTVYNDDFMGGIDIESAPIQGESNRVIVQCRVSGRVVLDKSAVVNRIDEGGNGRNRGIQFGSGFWSTSPPILGHNRYLEHVRQEIQTRKRTRTASQAWEKHGLNRRA